MLDLPKVSVIVPVYNVENYLEECLDSLVNQTLIDFEIICIDDGSTDRSLEILRQYESQYPNFRIFTQNNNGPSKARNVGLDNALGEYIYFMDSDDILSKFALKNLYTIAKAKSLDLIIFKLMNFNDETGEKFSTDYYDMKFLKETVGDSVFSHRDLDSNYIFKIAVSPPAKFYRREILDDLRFPEGLLFEDNVFFTHAIFKADRIYFHDKFLYNRRKRSNSTTTPITVRSIDTIDITNMLLDLCEEYDHPRHKGELYYRIFHNIYMIFKKADSSQKEQLFQKIKHDYVKSEDKWRGDEYFRNELNPKYKHIFNCALKSKNAEKFEKCVDNYSKESRLKRLRNKLL